MISRVLLCFALSVSFLPTVTGQQPQPRQTPDPQKTTSPQPQNPPDIEPQDVVRIASNRGEVGALQQFTTDKRMLYNAIDHLHWYPCSRTGLYVFAPAGSQTTSSEAPCGGARNIRDTLRSLKFIVQGMRDLPGRKSLVLFSDHLPIETQEPGTTNSQVQSQSNTSSIDTGDADFDNDTTSYLPQFQKVAELAIRASVVIYAVDTRGLQYTGPTAADRIVAT